MNATSRGRGRRVAARLAASALLAACTMLLAPQPASACDVSYGYKPSVNISDLSHHRTCSTSTSTTGVVIVAVLAFCAVAVLGLAVVRRAEGTARALEGSEPMRVLDDYLQAAGVAPPPAQASGEAPAGGHDAQFP